MTTGPELDTLLKKLDKLKSDMEKKLADLEERHKLALDEVIRLRKINYFLEKRLRFAHWFTRIVLWAWVSISIAKFIVLKYF